MMFDRHKIVRWMGTKHGVFLIVFAVVMVILFATNKRKNAPPPRSDVVVMDEKPAAAQPAATQPAQPAQPAAAQPAGDVSAPPPPTVVSYRENASSEPPMVTVRRSAAAATPPLSKPTTQSDSAEFREILERKQARAPMTFTGQVAAQKRQNGGSDGEPVQRTIAVAAVPYKPPSPPEQASGASAQPQQPNSRNQAAAAAAPDGGALAPAGVITQRSEPAKTAFAPFGRLLKCELVNTVDSSAAATPIIGLVTEDLYWNGRLIVPANSEVHGTATVDRFRERIATGNRWTLVMYSGEDKEDGRTLQISGMGLDREDLSVRSGVETYAISDASYGLKGYVIRDSQWDEIMMFAATALGTMTEGLLEFNTQTGGFGTTQVPSATAKNAGLQGASRILLDYAAQIEKRIMAEGIYVRVPAGKQFYVYVTQELAPWEPDAGAAFTPQGAAVLDALDATKQSAEPTGDPYMEYLNNYLQASGMMNDSMMGMGR